ncbi:MAG: winged helix-turn-helix transcriptional regulator [Candidatus Thermoplasmatota archaeon]|nr:winged helix-turn-helix transcriptional regulator [Candidatus Thermoplasmatota archaeon]
MPETDSNTRMRIGKDSDQLTLVLFAIITVFALLSLAVSTSVFLVVGFLMNGFQPLEELLYSVIVITNLVTLYFSAMGTLRGYRKFISSRTEQPARAGTASREVKNGGQVTVPGLNQNEELILEILRKNGGRMLQNSIVREVNMSGPTVTRILISLENKGLVERKRHGMTNEILLEMR